jgi:hypothetical protein
MPGTSHLNTSLLLIRLPMDLLKLLVRSRLAALLTNWV